MSQVSPIPFGTDGAPQCVRNCRVAGAGAGVGQHGGAQACPEPMCESAPLRGRARPSRTIRRPWPTKSQRDGRASQGTAVAAALVAGAVASPARWIERQAPQLLAPDIRSSARGCWRGRGGCRPALAVGHRAHWFRDSRPGWPGGCGTRRRWPKPCAPGGGHAEARAGGRCTISRRRPMPGIASEQPEVRRAARSGGAQRPRYGREPAPRRGCSALLS